MCIGGDNKTKQTNKIDDPVLLAAKNRALGLGLDIMNQTYPGYDASKRVAGFTPDQRAGFGAVKKYANSPLELSNERLVDENGQLGKIKDYMDPYLQNALQPSIRDMQQAGQIQRNDIGDAATSAGAYGDARHGVAETGQMQMENQQIGDLTSRAYSNAYQTGMGMRAADLGRFDQNTQLEDQAALNRALSLLGVGDQQQQNAQQKADAYYQEFLNAREWPFRQWDIFGGLMGSTPTAQTQTVSQPNNWLAAMLGSLGGSAFRGG
jgi:hypothetical protein